MKKVMVMIILLISPVFVNAAKCESSEQIDLESRAGLIKVNYEEKEKEVSYEGPCTEYSDEQECKFTVHSFDLNLVNVTEDFYVVITNDINDEAVRVNYSSVKDNMYTFEHTNMTEVANYTFTIYTSNKTSCPDQKLEILRLVVPKLNSFSTREECVGFEDESVCKKYTTIKGLDNNMFQKKIIELNKALIEKEEEKNENFATNAIDYIKDNYKNIIGVAALVVGVGGATVYLINKKRSSLK